MTCFKLPPNPCPSLEGGGAPLNLLALPEPDPLQARKGHHARSLSVRIYCCHVNLDKFVGRPAPVRAYNWKVSLPTYWYPYLATLDGLGHTAFLVQTAHEFITGSIPSFKSPGLQTFGWIVHVILFTRRLQLFRLEACTCPASFVMQEEYKAALKSSGLKKASRRSPGLQTRRSPDGPQEGLQTVFRRPPYGSPDVLQTVHKQASGPQEGLHTATFWSANKTFSDGSQEGLQTATVWVRKSSGQSQFCL